MENVEELDLREILQMLQRHKKTIIILPLLAILSAAILSFFVLEPVYQAQTTLIVNKKTLEGVALDQNTIRLNRDLASTYKELITSRRVGDKAIATIQEMTGLKEVKSNVSVQVVGDTELLKITVDDKNPELAALYANVLAKTFGEEIQKVMNVDNVKIVDEAIVPETPIKPNKKLNIAIAAVIGLMAAVGLAFVVEFLDDTVKKPEEMEKELGLPVLGIIPNHNLKY